MSQQAVQTPVLVQPQFLTGPTSCSASCRICGVLHSSGKVLPALLVPFKLALRLTRNSNNSLCPAL